MNREDLIRILKSEPIKFTYAEIEQMMDEELAKSPDEMDTDFVDLCAETLCNALSSYTNKETEADKTENKKYKSIKFVKIIAIVAILILILGIAIPTAAKYINNDTSDKIVQFYKDHFAVNLGNSETEADKHSDDDNGLVAELKKNGFDNVILPSVLLESDYTYTVKVTENDEFVNAVISFMNKNDNSMIYAKITKHKNGINRLFNNNAELTTEYDSAKQLSLNGMDILVFGNKEASTITYIDNNIDYDIELTECSFDSAVEIAKSIK